MKIIAVVEADFGHSGIGTRSRLAEPLDTGGASEPVLRRTLRRLLQCKRLSAVHLAVHVSEKAMADELAGDLGSRCVA